MRAIIAVSLVVALGIPLVAGSCAPAASGDGGTLLAASGGEVDSNSGPEYFELGQQELAQHDVRHACQAFDSAARQSNGSAEAELAAGLCAILTVAEHPAALEAMRLLGERPLPLLDAVTGPNGWLAHLESGRTESFSHEVLRSSLPWWQRNNLPNVFTNTLRGTTGDAVLEALFPLQAYLAEAESRLVSAAAADHVDLRLDGGIVSVPGTIRLDRSDALLLAGVARFTVAALRLLRAYDWGWDLAAAFGITQSGEERLEAVNGRLLRLKSSVTDLTDIREDLSEAADHVIAALDHVIDVRHAAADPDWLISWSGLEPLAIDRLRGMAVAFRGALAGPVELPFFTPPTTVDLSGLFTAPFSSAHSAFEPIDGGNSWSDHGWTFVEGFWRDLVDGLFEPSLFDSAGAGFSVPWYSYEALGGFSRNTCRRLAAAQPAWWACDRDGRAAAQTAAVYHCEAVGGFTPMCEDLLDSLNACYVAAGGEAPGGSCSSSASCYSSSVPVLVCLAEHIDQMDCSHPAALGELSDAKCTSGL